MNHDILNFVIPGTGIRIDLTRHSNTYTKAHEDPIVPSISNSYTYWEFSNCVSWDIGCQVLYSLGVRGVLHHIRECVALQDTIALLRLIPQHTHWTITDVLKLQINHWIWNCNSVYDYHPLQNYKYAGHKLHLEICELQLTIFKCPYLNGLWPLAITWMSVTEHSNIIFSVLF